MSVTTLLAELRQRGVAVWVEGDRLLYKPRSAVNPELRERLAAHKAKLLQALDHGGERHLHSGGVDGPHEVHPPADLAPSALNSASEPEGLLERFLEDDSIPAAVFRSRALGRNYVLARDDADLDALSDAAQALPVIWFGECEQLQHLTPEDLEKILDIRAVFGPAVYLVGLEVGHA